MILYCVQAYSNIKYFNFQEEEIYGAAFKDETTQQTCCRSALNTWKDFLYEQDTEQLEMLWYIKFALAENLKGKNFEENVKRGQRKLGQDFLEMSVYTRLVLLHLRDE